VTGMAQVSGRSNLLFTEEAKLDIFYIENWSLLLDLVILFKTPFIIINREVD
jgi:lipopolysaccharide/colanic/teichoic acid biosynthesis glycosyltransferase